MKVSIVIPVYNAEKYLKECVDSTINQTYDKIEIIAVDDGSTDNSLKILQKYSDKIKIISKPNGGTASALNIGIKNMTGEWFKWLSADDVLYPNAIQELVLEGQRLKDKKKSILYSNYEIIDSNGKTVKEFIEPNYNDLSQFELNTLLLDHYIGNGTTSLIHKSALDEYGVFDETIGFAEDYELWLRFCLIHGCRLVLVPRVLAKYRVHESQLSQSKAEKALNNAVKIRKMVLEKLSPAKRKMYQKAQRQLKKNECFHIKARHILRDIMFRVLPKSCSERILNVYFKKFKEEN